ncbi:hypothetical protein Tco_1500558 [Tanacetum coccineum]
MTMEILPEPTSNKLCDKMAEENVPAPTRTDNQLVLVKARLPIGKSNLLMDLQKTQKNPIFCISNTLTKDSKTRVYSFQLDELWFTLNVDLLRSALGITPKDSVHPFVPPLAGDLLIDFFNNLGYPEELQFVSKIQSKGSYQEAQASCYSILPFHQADHLLLGNKGGMDEVFGMAIPRDLITEAIQNSKYYKKYLEMAARKPRQPTTTTGEEGEKKKKAPEANKSKQPSPAKQTKPVKEKTSKPTPSKKIHKGRVMKVRKEKRSGHLVDEEDEESQPATKPQVEDDEYNLQRGIQMILESLHEQGQGRQAPVGGVAIRETNPGLIQKLPEVEGKGKGIVSEEKDDTSANVVYDTSSPADSTNDVNNVADMELSTSKADTEILNVDEEHGKEVSHTVALEERTVKLDEGQAGSDPGKTPESRPLPKEDHARSDPGQSHVAQVGPNPEPMHEDFIATVYPAVHENLKLTTEEQVYIENPPSSSRTLSSMKNLEDAFTFGDQFINGESTKEEPGKANVETEVESMVTVPIHQASSSVPPLSTPIIDLTPPKPVLPPVQEPICIATTATTTTLLPPPPPLPQSITDPDLATRVSALEKRILLRERFRDLSEVQMKEILHDQKFESGSYKSHPDHSTLYKALEASMQCDNNDELHAKLTSSSNQKPSSPPLVNDDPIPDDMHLSESEDTDVAHLPKIKTRPNWFKPLPEEEAPETPKPDWIGKSKLVKADLEGQAYKIVRPFHKNSISLQFQMEDCHLLLIDQIDLMNPESNRVVHDISKPLPLGAPPGQVTIQTQYFFNKYLEYLISGNKERRHALSISKLKAAYYPDFRLEELVPSLWTKSESDYDISSAYGILHWWFKRKEFYITRHSDPLIEVRADYKEYKISEADFKNLHPNDFEDMYLLHLQGKLNYLSRVDKVALSTAVNLWTRNIVIRQRVEDLQLEDCTIVHKPRAIIYKDRNDQKMMRKTEVHKFSDGTLKRILEKLDYMVKDYELFKFNPGMENQI